MGIDIKVRFRESGLQIIHQKLTTLKDKLKQKIVADAMLEGAKIQLAAAKTLVPVADGDLKRSLAARKKTSRYDIGAQVYARRGKQFPGGYYAHLIEKGHKQVRKLRNGKTIYLGYYSAHAYMRPALLQNQQEILQKVTSEARAGIKKATNT